MVMKQIQNYTGCHVKILCRDGTTVNGILSFYNWEAQVVHLSDYVMVLPDYARVKHDGPEKTALPLQGPFIILNKSDWLNLVITEE